MVYIYLFLLLFRFHFFLSSVLQILFDELLPVVTCNVSIEFAMVI